MKIGVMQPYLFPYIGYWQLLNAVDKYVILDDVNFIMRGYINRNSILINGQANRFTIPILHASQNTLICDTKLNFPLDEKKKFLEKISLSYKKAPLFDMGYSIVEDIILNEEEDLTEFIFYSMERIKEYLGINTPIVKSSNIEKDSQLRAQERIIAICKKLGGTVYINPSGGRELYSKEKFAKEGLSLFFLDPQMPAVKYKQFGNDFVNNLSIIDVIMFNEVSRIKEFLELYELNAE